MLRAILIEAQRDGCDDEQLHALQADLTQNYDTFVKEFGNIHKRGNKLAFRKDAGYPLLLALEKLDDEQNVIGKTAIFSKRTISPHMVCNARRYTRGCARTVAGRMRQNRLCIYVRTA